MTADWSRDQRVDNDLASDTARTDVLERLPRMWVGANRSARPTRASTLRADLDRGEMRPWEHR